MGLPALTKIRERFPNSRLTFLVGKSPASLLRQLNIGNEVIAVDRVALLRGRKLNSIREILKLVRDIRRRRFDFVIDLHSLSETNILGFLSGARHRLYGNRESRSLDFLGNFRPRPEREDKSKHLADYYLTVVAPLGIDASRKGFRIEATKEDADAFIEKYFSDADGARLIGFVVGAGHPSRQWPLERFAELSRRISATGGFKQVVFLGPEEEGLATEIHSRFGADVVVDAELSIYQLLAVARCLELLVGNDTGPTHIAALAGTPIVLISDERAPTKYVPLTDKINVIRTTRIEEISVDEVEEAVRSVIGR